MAKRSLPQARMTLASGDAVRWEVSPRALERWAPDLAPQAAQGDTAPTISILDPIGSDPWTGEGVTAKRVDSALRSIGAKADVVVNINSPGGDMFEGMAIYNLLREHKGEVTVRVLGMAVSAASFVAMAGDKVEIAASAFFMIHDTWIVTMGNRNDLREAADMLEPFDNAMADIYSARSGMKASEVLKMMDAETWINANKAIDLGFADSLLSSDQVSKQARSQERIAAHALDVALAKAGLPRSERRALLSEFKAGTQNAADPDALARETLPAPTAVVTQNAAAELELMAALRSFDLSSLNV